MARVALSRDQMDLLQSVVTRWAPELLSSVENLSVKSVSHQDRLALADAVFEELMSSGVGSDGQINPSGVELDTLIGVLKPSEEDDN